MSSIMSPGAMVMTAPPVPELEALLVTAASELVAVAAVVAGAPPALEVLGALPLVVVAAPPAPVGSGSLKV